MPYVVGAVPNLIQGISQQAPTLRLASQASNVVNGYGTILDGMMKRPPIEHRAKLTALPLSTAGYAHFIDRDVNERYVVLINNGSIRVFTLDGVERTVLTPDGVGYLVNQGLDSDSFNDFRCITVQDYTFVLNRTAKVVMTSTTQVVRQPEALVYIKVGNYNTAYKVTVGGTTVTYNSTAAATSAQTDAIATSLAALIAALPGGYTVTTYGSTIHITRATPFTISASDSFGDQAITAISGKVQSAALLPLNAPDGFQIEVEGQVGNRFDNYFLTFQATSGASGAGIWRETPAPGRKLFLNPTKMPHLLIRNSDGTFTFKAATWSPCGAGSVVTAPEPSIVDRKISDVFFYRNRLGFISGQQVVFSRGGGEYFNLWRETATQLLETDPIDVAVSHVKVTDLRYAVPFNESLLLFADRSQFIVPPSQTLSPLTIAINQTTEFDATLGSRPVGIGSFIYFAAEAGSYLTVHEFFLDGDLRNGQANDVTDHVPRLIRGGLRDFAGSPAEGFLGVITSGAPNKLLVYKFSFSGDQKTQSAWKVWEFPLGSTLMSAEVIDGALWAVVNRADGAHVERIRFDPSLTTGDLSFVPKLDRQISCAGLAATFSGGITTITLPFNYGDPSLVPQGIVVSDSVDGLYTKGTWLKNIARGAGNTITIPGDWTVNKAVLVVGLPYLFDYTFSPFFVRQQASNGSFVAASDGRLQISRVTVTFAETGAFKAVVQTLDGNRPVRTYAYDANAVAGLVTDSPVLRGGNFTFPIGTENLRAVVRITNDTPYPCRFINAEWKGQWAPVSRRIP